MTSVYIPDSTLQQLISEDIPYYDLTTTTLGIGDKPGCGEFFTREDCVVCGTEEVSRLFEMLGCRVTWCEPSGSQLKAGATFLKVEGCAAGLHQGWKVCLNLLDRCSGIATRTAAMVRSAREVTPGIEVLATRKSMPGTKQLVTKAILAGGASSHRLGLSESVLVFQQHLAFMGGMDELVARLPQLKRACCEKVFMVETGEEDALRLARAGVGGLQFDKVSPERLTGLVAQVREVAPDITLLAAGGVKPSNIAAYAATGVDGLVTSAPFNAPPVDMSMRMEALG